MAEAEITIHLLEDIKDILQYSLENNEYTRVFFGKVHGNITESNSVPKESSHESSTEEKSPEERGTDRINLEGSSSEPLENLLHEKLQENARLKALNGRLLLTTRQKSQKIKELERALSLRGQLVQNSKAISCHRDKLGRCNVEIQKLRKQLKVDTKRLQSERSRSVRFETKSRDRVYKIKSLQGSIGDGDGTIKSALGSIEDGDGTIKSALGSIEDGDGTIKSALGSIEDGDGTRVATPGPSRVPNKLHEDPLQKMLRMIELQAEPSIHDETLDMPESLDSDSDENCQCV